MPKDTVLVEAMSCTKRRIKILAAASEMNIPDYLESIVPPVPDFVPPAKEQP